MSENKAENLQNYNIYNYAGFSMFFDNKEHICSY